MPAPEAGAGIARRAAIRALSGLGLALSLLLPPLAGSAASQAPLRVAVLKYGTVNWTLEAMRAAGFDRKHGLSLALTGYASSQATRVALLAGDTDMIVADWIWAARQRAEGRDLRYLPYSGAVGAVMVPAASRLRGIADLAGTRLGIAGGPLDKSWLALQAVARRDHGLDLATQTRPSFGAPPLLSEMLRQGRLDAVLTFWHFAARLQAEGFRRLTGANDLFAALGAPGHLPLLGFVAAETATEGRADSLERFAAALEETFRHLRHADPPWQALRPRMRAPDEAGFTALREGFRAGSPPFEQNWPDALVRLHAVLAELGGADLVGRATRLDPALFWTSGR